jgi:hypothetical protein
MTPPPSSTSPAPHPLDVVLRLAFPESAPDHLWRSPEGVVPAFWPAAFPREAFDRVSGSSPIVIDGTTALAQLAARNRSWKIRSASKIHRGYRRFEQHLHALRPSRISLELPDQARALVPDIRHLLDFLDGRTDHPGRLLAASRETLMWKRRATGYRLEAVLADATWPDELPLFASPPALGALVGPTLGDAPFGRGPWPERRFAEDPDAELPKDADARREEARRALKLLAIATAKTRGAERWSNLDLVNQACGAWATFLGRGSALADSAAAFGERHHVLDDGPIWRELVADGRRTMLRLRRFGRQLEPAA